MIQKSRYWVAVCYPENMVDDWQSLIADILQYPFSYCIHRGDLDTKKERRKDHVHIILAFNNTTTYNHAYNVFSLLSALDRSCLNKIEAVINIRHVYDYLIHDTEQAKKDKKHLYSPHERINGNNFDIGAFEQISITEKNQIIKDLAYLIRDNEIHNFADFYFWVLDNYQDTEHFECLKTYSGMYERICRGIYHKKYNHYPSDTTT